MYPLRQILAGFALGGLLLSACENEPDPQDPQNDPTTADPEHAQIRKVLAIPELYQVPDIPQYNPISTQKIELGRHLFYDRRLSANQTQSCADCHEQSKAFTDGKAQPLGSTGQRHTRNSMGLANVAYLSTLSWAAKNLLDLETQILIPLINDNPIELGITDAHRQEVLARIEADPRYQKLFSAAFPGSDGRVTINRISFALASFCRSLLSFNSPYDRYIAGDQDALTPLQKQGLGLFQGERFECFHCHGGVQQTAAYHDVRKDEHTLAFFNTGLYNVGGNGDFPEHDQGLFQLTLAPDHRGLFRPPPLRNIALTAPYMHDGSIATLEQVVRHYAAGGRNIIEGPFAGDGRVNPLKSGLVGGFYATDEEIAAVVAFLESLTDPTFISDPRFQDPWSNDER